MERRRNFDKMPTFVQMKAREQSYADSLFSGINQFEYQDEDGYSCKWPIFYREQKAILGVFAARYKDLRRLLPKDPGIKPVQVLPGISLIYMMVIESGDTDIEPYNSVLIVTPIRNPAFIGLISPLKVIPGYELLRQALITGIQNWFVWRIPDDSFISYKVGYEAFGMPKFSCDLTWEEEGNRIVYSAVDEGEEVFTVHVEKKKICSLEKGFILNALACFYRDRLPMMEYGKVMFKEFGLALGSRGFRLELGSSHPLSKELEEVLISTKPLAWVHIPQGNMVIYEPSRWALDVLDLFHKRMGVS